MLKKFLFLILMLVSLVCKSNALSFSDRLHFEAAAGTGVKMHGITPLDYSFKLNVDVAPRFYVSVVTETEKSLYKDDKIKTYFNGRVLVVEWAIIFMIITIARMCWGSAQR